MILKTILRDVRKFYRVDFKKTSDFECEKRLKYKQPYMHYVKEYAYKRFKNVALDSLEISFIDLAFTIGSIIYPKRIDTDKLEGAAASWKQKVNKIYETLYFFSAINLQQLMDNPTFVLLFVVYLQKQRYLKLIASPSKKMNFDTYVAGL